jgi:hypothetical protein
LHQKIDTVVYEISSLAAQEREGRQKRGGDRNRMPLSVVDTPGANVELPEDAEELLALDEALERLEESGEAEGIRQGSARLDSGARCNRSMKTGFARLCQAL